MKEGWNIEKMGEVMLIARGGSPRPIKKYLTDSPDGFNWIKISDATASDKYIYNTKQKITEEGLHKTRLVEEGDFILSNSMSFGRPYIMKTKGCIHDGWLVLKEKEKNILDKDFLYHLLGSPYIFKEFDRLAAGSTVRNLNISLVSSVLIPIPPLPEQKAIVKILDKAFAKIDQAKANIEKNIENAKELLVSYMQDEFSNNVDGKNSESLNDICELIVDCEHKTAPTQETGYPSIRTPNIGFGKLILENVNLVSEETYNKWTRRAIPLPGDLILAREAPAGNIGEIPENTFVCLGQRTVLIRPKKDKFISKYLAYLILSKNVQEKLLSHSQGATVGHINMRDIRAFKIYNLPKVSSQEKIVASINRILKEVEKIKSTYDNEIDNLEELKKSLLQKAFAGELIKMSEP